MFLTKSTNKQKVPLTLVPRSGSGDPSSIDGDLRFTVQDGDASVEYDGAASQLSCFVVSGDSVGVSHILVEGDRKLGPELELIQEVIEYTVNAEEAESFGVTAGAPVPK